MDAPTSHTVARFRSALGEFTLHGFGFGGREHAVLVHGNPHDSSMPLVRIQSACLTGCAFLAELCDCRQQLHAAMRLIADEGSGIVVHLAQEGRGHGLVEKVAQLGLIAEGMDTVEAAAARGLATDVRDYSDTGSILRTLLPQGAPVRLLTNNLVKLQAVRAAGVAVVERVSLEVAPTDGNRGYLLVKKNRMGHLLEMV